MEKLTCHICNNNDDNRKVTLKGTMYGTKGQYEYFICSKCGCLQIAEKPQNIDVYYDVDQYYAFNMEKRKLKNKLLFLQLKNQIQHRNFIGQLVQSIYPVNYKFYKYVNPEKDSILDVGCGDGEILKWLSKLGYQNLSGIDPYIAKDIIYEEKIKIVKTEIDKFEAERKYQMITFIHSLEHIYEEHQALKVLDGNLANGGYMVFQLPYFSKYYWNKYGENLYTLDPPRHFYIHTYESLIELMKPLGYEVVDFDTEIDVAIPKMAKQSMKGKNEKNQGTDFLSGTIISLFSRQLRKRLKERKEGAIATIVFRKMV